MKEKDSGIYAPAIRFRTFQGDGDFGRVHHLLIETYSIIPVGFNWDIRRWEGKRFYGDDPEWDPQWEKTFCLWETGNSQLIGAIHPEGRGDAHLQIHPDYRHIEGEMIAWAEAHLAVPTEDGKRQLHTYVFEYDTYRQRLLTERGYEKLDGHGVIRHLRFWPTAVGRTKHRPWIHLTSYQRRRSERLPKNRGFAQCGFQPRFPHGR